MDIIGFLGNGSQLNGYLHPPVWRARALSSQAREPRRPGSRGGGIGGAAPAIARVACGVGISSCHRLGDVLATSSPASSTPPAWDEAGLRRWLGACPILLVL